ncbi:hypothetical protein V1477_007023 [Vespula maculifrons]|uniref:Uncharacterized protein n=1 Tax=Vespula maculifrons TaxID=7453 RepID=A0ABD2CHJ5_VESMC
MKEEEEEEEEEVEEEVEEEEEDRNVASGCCWGLVLPEERKEGRKMEGFCLVDGINKLSTNSSNSSSGSGVVIVVKYVGINQRPRHRVGSDGAGSSIHGIAISKITIPDGRGEKEGVVKTKKKTIRLTDRFDYWKVSSNRKYQGFVEPLNLVISSSFNSAHEPSSEAHQGPLYVSLMFFCIPEALAKYTQLGFLAERGSKKSLANERTRSSGLIVKSFYRSWFSEEIVKIARNTTPLDNWSADGLTADGATAAVAVAVAVAIGVAAGAHLL